MENKSSFHKDISKLDLPFWKENLKREKERLKGLLEFSKGVEHSATMDAGRNVKRYEDKIKEIKRISRRRSMNNSNKKEVAQEGLVQEQPQFTKTIDIANLDKLNTLISEITDKLNELKNFKLEIKTQLDIDMVAEKFAEKLKQSNLYLK